MGRRSNDGLIILALLGFGLTAFAIFVVVTQR